MRPFEILGRTYVARKQRYEALTSPQKTDVIRTVNFEKIGTTASIALASTRSACRTLDAFEEPGVKGR